MVLLHLGLALFILVHLVPVFARPVRNGAIDMMGPWPYRGLFSLAALAALFLVHRGWITSPVEMMYMAPTWAFHVTPLFVLAAFILFIGSRAPGNIKRLVRHPQLTAVLLWAVGHLLANGETRSVALFGSFAIWSVLAMWGTNRRDGAWVKPARQAITMDIVILAIAIALFAGFFMLHEMIIGVRPLP